MQNQIDNSRLWMRLSAGLGLLTLTGCSLIGGLYEPRPVAAPQAMIPVEAKAEIKTASLSDGSIWTNASMHTFVDNKAFRAGDVVLVRVSQRNSGSKNANTDTARKSSFSATINRFLGLEGPVNQLTDYTNDAGPKPNQAGWAPYPLVDATTENSFKGTGTTNRTDNLAATVSAIVTDVLPNGNLVIYGHQTVTLNHESSVLTVQGVVRPADIAANNSIDADRIANADIRFDGSGVVSDKQHPGWATRALDWILPF